MKDTDIILAGMAGRGQPAEGAAHIDPAKQRLIAHIEWLETIRAIRIKKGRACFWEYCKLMAPAFYTDDKLFLRDICDKLQLFFERKLINPKTGKQYVKFMLNIPPRFGKTRTLELFCEWVLGINRYYKLFIICYGDTLSSRFTADVRDTINSVKTEEEYITYGDIFPETKIKKGDATKQLWSLEDTNFTFLATSLTAKMTGFGCDLAIIDDPIRSAVEAMNMDYLEGQWDWYGNTFKQRTEEGARQIINMTRWSINDLCGKLIKLEGDEWYQVVHEARDRVTGKMLHEGTMSAASYEDKKKPPMTRNIFMANYHQQPFELEGSLYKGLQTYSIDLIDDNYVLRLGNMPINSKNVNECVNGVTDLFERVVHYTDVADQGKDWLCAISAGVFEGQGFILDVLYTNEGTEITEGQLADHLIENKVNRVKMESQSGGHIFSRNVKKLLWSVYGTRDVVFDDFHQKENKMAKILTGASFVINNMFFPKGWETLFPEFYNDMINYQKNAKGQLDDAPDAVTGLADMVKETGNITPEDHKAQEEANREYQEQIV